MRVVDQHGRRPHGHGVDLRPEPIDRRVRLCGSQLGPHTGGLGHAPIETCGDLHRHERAATCDPGEKGLVLSGHRRPPYTDVDLHPVIAKIRDAGAVDLRVGVDHPDDDPTDTSFDDSMHAGTGAADVTAGLERAIQRRVTCSLVGLRLGFVQRSHLGVRQARPLVIPRPDDGTLRRDHHRTNHRVGAAVTTAPLR